MVESRFKEGDKVKRSCDCYDEWLTWPWNPNHGESCSRCGKPLTLVSRRDWIDPNEWLNFKTNGDTDNGHLMRMERWYTHWATHMDALAWMHFVDLVCSGSVSLAVGSGSWKKPEELVAVSMRRGLAEKIGTNWLSTHEHGELWAACRTALDAEASR